MAINTAFPIDHDTVYPHGAYLVSAVTMALDFDRSTKEKPVQRLDENGVPLWQVDVLDGDPDVKKRARQVTVRIASKTQPVPPNRDGNSPFIAVRFDGLRARAWVDDSGPRPQIAWSFTASGMRSPASQKTAA